MQTNIKKQVVIFVICLLTASFSTLCSTFATDHRDLSDEEIGAISQNCSSIKIRLYRVQKDDARNRIYLGSQYEALASKLMLNLNLRLVKNGLINTPFAEQQASFSSERERFKNDYIGYSQEFENLLKLDCKKEPTEFYRQLELVREKRLDINASMERLKDTFSSHYQSVNNLRDELNGR